MKKDLLTFIFCCCWMLALGQRGIKPDPTPEKVALVIGNGLYPDKPLELQNPTNDAKDMAELLGKLGFKVLLYTNLTKEGMDKAHSEFIGLLNSAKVGVFYYAGHGFESQTSNTQFLNSVETRSWHTLNQAIERSLSLETVFKDMQASNPKGINLLFVDACRTFKDRGPNKGKKVDLPAGTLAFFGSSPGEPTDENSGNRNGLFTQELKKRLMQPNLELMEMIRNTSKAVVTLNPNQHPYPSGILYEAFYFNPTPPGSWEEPTPSVQPPTYIDEAFTKKPATLILMKGSQFYYVESKSKKEIKVRASGEMFFSSFTPKSTPQGNKKSFLGYLTGTQNIDPNIRHGALIYRLTTKSDWQYCGQECSIKLEQGNYRIEFKVNNRGQKSQQGQFDIQIVD
ncbi:caspase family protein [Runella sp.]|uniref:caspase family protein n=1 Tax=Runella sp. TaxID=1960881 RepID=UPI00301A8989